MNASVRPLSADDNRRTSSRPCWKPPAYRCRSAMHLDRTELRDLAAARSDEVARLSRRYDDWARRCGVLPWHELQQRAKVPSTPDDYGRGVLQGLAAALSELDLPTAGVAEIVHGFTVATNAILGREGRGDGADHHRGLPRDVLEIARLRVPRLYDPAYRRSNTTLCAASRSRLGVRRPEILYAATTGLPWAGRHWRSARRAGAARRAAAAARRRLPRG